MFLFLKRKRLFFFYRKKKNMSNLKIVLLGDAGVGKTALANQWLDEANPLKTSATVGASFKRQFIDIDGQEYCLNIWDTAGDERYQSTIPIYCRDASAALIVFDLTRSQTFENLQKWIDLVVDINGNVPIVICANKSDLDEKRSVTEESIVAFTKPKNLEYFETSALTGYMVNEAFNALSISAAAAFKQTQEKKEENIPLNNNENGLKEAPKEKSSCC